MIKSKNGNKKSAGKCQRNGKIIWSHLQIWSKWDECQRNCQNWDECQRNGQIICSRLTHAWQHFLLVNQSSLQDTVELYRFFFNVCAFQFQLRQQLFTSPLSVVASRLASLLSTTLRALLFTHVSQWVGRSQFRTIVASKLVSSFCCPNSTNNPLIHSHHIPKLFLLPFHNFYNNSYICI